MTSDLIQRKNCDNAEHRKAPSDAQHVNEVHSEQPDRFAELE